MITIIDYKMGNLRSVQKAFERVGQQAIISGNPKQIEQADRLVLPGVGAFGDAMRELGHRGLIEPIRQAVSQGKPFLGICLGLQLLFDIGHEGGRHEGLGILPGEVHRFQLPADYKVPHMGWNQLRIVRRPPLLDGIDEGTYFYFVHSFFVVPRDQEVVATQTDYGIPFCSSIWRANIFATQFHPEKSQALGLRILKNFAELPVLARA